jgi:hypothetical protein
MRPQYINDDYQFPLPVQDMNNEIMARLDDESLYRLCQTNKQMSKFCLSNNIWTLRANSPLAPLYIVRDQYKNWMDFYANVRKDYLYYVNGHFGGGFTSIMKAFSGLLDIVGIPHKQSYEELESVASRTDLIAADGEHRFIALIRKCVIYDREEIHENILYSIGGGGGDFVNPDMLKFPDLVDIPVMELELMDDSIIMRTYIDFNEQALAELKLIPDVLPNFSLLFNNRKTVISPISSLGWHIRSGHFEYNYEIDIIVNKTALAVEGIDINKSYIVNLPTRAEHAGKTYYLYGMIRRTDIPEEIDTLRWYITTFGTFYKIEDIANFLQEEDFDPT